jgi:hypothetical protein
MQNFHPIEFEVSTSLLKDCIVFATSFPRVTVLDFRDFSSQGMILYVEKGNIGLL